MMRVNKKAACFSLLMVFLIIVRIICSIVDNNIVKRYTLDPMFLTIVILVSFLIILNKVVLKAENIISEDIRQSILESYKLTDVQAKFKVSMGDDVYVENDTGGVFIMLSGMRDGKVRIKNLFSMKETFCELKQFLDSFSDLVSYGYKFYDSESYRELLKKGFRLQYEAY